MFQTVAYESELTSDGTISLIDSEGNVATDLNSILSLLINQYSDNKTDRLCWNLDDTTAVIFRLLPKDLATKLYTEKSIKIKVEDTKGRVTPWELFYIPDKLLSVERRVKRQAGNQTAFDKANLYGLDQYYPQLSKPQDITDIKNYGIELRKKLREMGFTPTKLTSPAAIYEECILSHLDLPTYKDIPAEANQYAYMCGGELWIEAHQMGYWKEVVDWDLTSAFPSVIATLADTRLCEWVQSSQFVEEAVYGYCKGVVSIPNEVQISPILLKRQDCVDVSPTGRWETYLTKRQIEYLKNTKRGSFEIEDGYWAIPKAQKEDYTLTNLVGSLVALRGKDKMIDYLAKRMSVSLYGKFGEEHEDKLGKHFNPVWFAEISTRIGLRVASFIYRHKLQEALIHVGVDGVMLDAKKIPADFALTDEEQSLWKKAYEGEALVSSSGMVFQGDKKPHGLTLKDVKALIKAQPENYEYSKMIRSRVSLGEALQVRYEELGMEVDKPGTMSLLTEHDRVFDETPRTGREILKNKYHSRPYRIEELEL